ncbi:MAG: helix-turn-helix domain-containing protein [Chloroflexi bacterium]|nr:helix-turn-helix domain-containing protein [Chloroflexota bacterium]
MKMPDDWITTDEAADIVGVTAHQIRHLLRNNVLKGQRFGRSWMVTRRSAEEYAVKERKPGPKPQSD